MNLVRNARKIVKSLYDEGCEVVIVAKNQAYDSCIFYRHENNIITLSRHIGTTSRKITDFTREQAREHFENMINEQAYIFIRGIE